MSGLTKSLVEREGARVRLRKCKKKKKKKKKKKYYAFYVKIHVSGDSPCVNPSKNIYRALIESTFDEVCLLIKMYSDDFINYYLKNAIWACPGVEPGTYRTLSENHATRPTGQSYMHFI